MGEEESKKLANSLSTDTIAISEKIVQSGFHPVGGGGGGGDFSPNRCI